MGDRVPSRQFSVQDNLRPGLLPAEQMGGERVERRLAAILAADVAGYSRLMGADEEGTLAALKAIRRELGDPKIAWVRVSSSGPHPAQKAVRRPSMTTAGRRRMP